MLKKIFAILAAILLLGSWSGVGEGDSAPLRHHAAAEQGRAPEASSCAAQTSEVVSALDRLREKLLAGLGYERFVKEVRAVKAVYARMPTEDMDLTCLNGAASTVWVTVDEYVYAVNAWTECIADKRCDLEAIEPVIERKWWVAGLFLTNAHEELLTGG